MQVVAPINKLIETVPFDVYCYSLDWHPSDHLSFVDNVHDHLTVDNDEEDETVENAERTTSRRSVNLPFNINTVGNSTVYRKTFHTLAHESILYES